MNQNNLFAYMASVVSQLKEERRMGTAHVYQSTLRRVMEFEGEETLDFKDLTPAWLKSFQDHLLDSLHAHAPCHLLPRGGRRCCALSFAAFQRCIYRHQGDGEARGGRRDLSQAQRSRR